MRGLPITPNARDINSDVDTTEPLDRFQHRVLDRRAVAHVELDGLDLDGRVQRADAARDREEVVVVAVRER